VRHVVVGGQTGTQLPHVSGKRIESFEFPLAPKPEQQRVVEVIESYLTRLDDAVATLERVERNLKRYRASLLKSAVEGRLVPTEAALAKQQGHSYEPAYVLLQRILVERRRRWSESGKKGKYQEPEPPDTGCLPDLPEGWCWATIEQLADVGTGATPKRGIDRFWKDGTIPWVTSSVVNDRRVVSPSEFVTDAALAETNLTLYPPGTLLVAMYGEGKTRGMISELAIEAATNQALAAIVLEGEAILIRDWLLVFFMHNYMELRRAASGGVQPNLNLGIVKAIVIPLPPMEEQKRITGEAESMLSMSESVGQSVAVQKARSSRLHQSILKWAFEGKLADQVADDEPASKLLQRIKAERDAGRRAKPIDSQRPAAGPQRIGKKKQVRA
jgi:type I restriction enzyme S subunit